MIVLLNIIGGIKAVIAAIYQNAYCDNNWDVYTDENNEPYTQ